MKIIVRDEQGIKKCFIQVRDVKYLVERFESPRLERLILGNNVLRDLKADDFFEVKNKGVIEIIDDNPYIVDFSDFVKYDGLTLSRIILLSQSFLPDEKKKLDEQHKVEDLLDVMNFKRGMLTYSIPIMYDEKTLFDNGEVVFGSTTMPGYFMLRSYDESVDLSDYLVNNLNQLYSIVNPEGEFTSYDVTPLDGSLLVRFTEKKKVFSNIIKRLTK